MKVSMLRGTIASKKEFVKYRNEEFVKGTLLIDGSELPIIGSKCALLKAEGKCNIECTIVQEQLTKGHRKTYLYIVRADRCEDQNLPDKNKIKIEGKVEKIYPTMFVGSAGTPLTEVKLRCFTRGEGVTFINIQAMGAKSEKCASIKKEYKVTAQCYLDVFNGEIRFRVLLLRYTTK